LKKKTKLVIIISAISFLVLTIPIASIFVSKYIKEQKLRNRIYFDNISIVLDGFYSRYRFPGNGSRDNPYRIENKIINSGSAIGIHIRETSAHFVIRNCLIISHSCAIYLDNPAPGTARIENNTCVVTNSSHADGCIDVRFTSNVLIKDNKVVNQYSQAYRCGILLVDVNDVSIINNTCSHFSYGIAQNDVDFPQAHNQDIFISNNTLEDNMFGILNRNTENVYLENNYFIGNTFGLYCESTNVTVVDNLFFGNNGWGLILQGTDIFVAYNVILGNEFGLLVLEPEILGYMIITRNDISHNRGWGLKCHQTQNTVIYHNNFVDNNFFGHVDYNLSQAYSTNQEIDSCYWYNSTLLEGNFWSDLTWTDEAYYVLDGYPYFIDPYPLEHPVEI
jgi:nitrous oxidase accessory protein NosD